MAPIRRTMFPLVVILTVGDAFDLPLVVVETCLRAGQIVDGVHRKQAEIPASPSLCVCGSVSESSRDGWVDDSLIGSGRTIVDIQTTIIQS